MSDDHIKLPELPEPLVRYRATFATVVGYTEEQVRDAQRAAVIADRAERGRASAAWSRIVHMAADPAFTLRADSGGMLLLMESILREQCAQPPAPEGE